MANKNRKILITGATEDVGQELVLKLARSGHQVWGLGQSEDLLIRLKKEAGEKFNYSVFDSQKLSDTDSVMAEMREKNFEPDVVILNAAAYADDINSNYGYTLINRELSINFLGSLVWVEKFLPFFIERKSGQFIGLSSSSVFRPDTHNISYAASKAALVMAFRSFRLRYSGSGVKFKMIYFGPVANSLTPYWISSESGKPKYFFVLSVAKAADYVMNAMNDGRRLDYFYPFWLVALIRATLFIPDKFFVMISRKLKQK